MRLSREKVNALAHAATHELAKHPEVKLLQDRNQIRLEIRQWLERLLVAEERIDAAVRQKITSQKREILEASQEWDILYRRYYQEAMKKLGV